MAQTDVTFNGTGPSLQIGLLMYIFKSSSTKVRSCPFTKLFMNVKCVLVIQRTKYTISGFNNLYFDLIYLCCHFASLHVWVAFEVLMKVLYFIEDGLRQIRCSYD